MDKMLQPQPRLHTLILQSGSAVSRDQPRPGITAAFSGNLYDALGEIRMKHGLELAISLIVLAAPLQQVAAESAPSSIIRTTYGQVSGVKDPHSSVTVFRGIPFAAPPVGALRWRPPVASAP